ncbi:hypothetical protein DNH61_12980 [Paenibacillus sambharensis]|uniref:Uncharacterized protein n=1 Tax=Paenibacillus sambharensis TaxID=1803190 RepID=A0A2W1LKB6_9BACL|nr:hypothetical protein [Paenibacillus sambharensis]PZD95442.1 hypothetical protein DNH61_12980 [Paenibacillus sambharensis]
MQEVTLEDLNRVQEELSGMRWNYWKSEVLFTFPWWFLIISMAVVLILWVRTVDKSRLPQIVICGLITQIVCVSFDVTGAELQLWDYPNMVIPWGSRLYSVDLMIGFLFMWIYQYAKSWSQYALFALLLALLFAFVLEPIAVWMDIYVPYNWHYAYSAPIYFLIALFTRWAADKVMQLQAKSRA